ncbi:sugar phosphate isomerase/epimerase [Bradyrhizobium rifense]|uniref:Sugar phosphate isomerase/epimerase n=1 Tax=Bradyrhizobium rifense TaxID=515499 RepID=A0A5D3K3U0_9BRAD|nr:sugar phosphate isomerase/epimerase [Bradyrhizobium rifense]TYL85652.1 sugar phosphate isomerase/epimerase [Bradyrhizobium rifense]
MPLLSLAHFTIIDAGPLELIEAGAAAGFDTVGLRIVPPPGAAPIVPVVGDVAMQRAIKARLAATGMRILDMEAVWLLPETDVASLGPMLDVSAELGAQHLLACGNDPDHARSVDNLARLCEAADLRGLRVMLEFLPYTHLRNLVETHALLQAAGPANAGILVDAVHLSRSGGHPTDLASYDPALFSFMHLCDVPATPPAFENLRAEARGGRLYPGEGGLWLDDFVRAFPAETAVAIEAPSTRNAALPAVQRAKLAADACRKLLARVGRPVLANRFLK